MKNKKNKKTTMILRNVPESLRRELKVRAAKEGRSMQGIAIEAIARYLAQK